jgi:hypothetical protein
MPSDLCAPLHRWTVTDFIGFVEFSKILSFSYTAAVGRELISNSNGLNLKYYITRGFFQKKSGGKGR